MRTTVWAEKSKLTDAISLRYYDPNDGKARRIYCTTRDEYKRKRLEIQTMLMNRRAGIRTGVHPLNAFDTYIESIRFTHRASTLKHKRNSIYAYLARFTAIEQLTSEVVEAWKRDMMSRYSSDTAAIRLRELRAFISWARKTDRTIIRPFDKVSIPKSSFVGRRLTSAEIQKLFDVMPPLAKPLITILLETGCRKGELLGMSSSELNLDRDFWTIPAARSKTRRSRIIPLSQNAKDAILSQGTPSGMIWPGWQHRRLHNNFKRALKAAGITDRVRLHDLRHTFASNWRGRAATLKAVCGWTTDQMMDHYTHVTLHDMREDMAKGGFGVDLGDSGKKEGTNGL